MVFSSSFIFAQERYGDGFYFIKRQALFCGLGFVLMAAIGTLDYRIWKKWAYLLLGVGFFLMLLSLIPGIGVKVKGAYRWLPIGGFAIQPAEFAKLAVILFVAKQLTDKSDGVRRFSSGVLACLLAPLPIFVALLLQPDFGTTVILILTTFVLMFLAGVRWLHLAGLIGAGVAAGALLILASPYRLSRITAFMDPWADSAGKGFQILQSLVGFHHGGLLGKGLGNGQEKLFFLPEAHNDFIFSVIGEELGFIGVTALILTYVFFVYRGLWIGWRSYTRQGDRFALLSSTGITMVIAVQGFLNMGVTMGLLPTKGMTLPFISYGGSAILVNFIAVGILMSIAHSKPQVHRGR